MRVAPDPEADAVYVHLGDEGAEAVRSVEMGRSERGEHVRVLDYSADDEPVGVELLYPTLGALDVTGLPRSGEIAMALLEAGYEVRADVGDPASEVLEAMAQRGPVRRRPAEGGAPRR